MASLRDIRKRIKSVKNTQKITKAMKMVSAAKLRRATDRVMASRPFADRITEAAADLALRAEALGEDAHPLLVARPTSKRGGKMEILAITSDRGLCGAFNSNVVRKALRLRFDMRDVHKEITMSTVGRKATEGIKREAMVPRRANEGVLASITFDKASAIAVELADRYLAGDVDSVHMVYNEFVNAATQRVVSMQILPIEPPKAKETTITPVDFEYEPGRNKLLSELLPRQLATVIYRALLESEAAEHAARMASMENASKNAKEMVGSLTLTYNRARQASITKELMEIIGGAEALKG
jgi:F-type H+-transporting ATPase subunit gamma